MITPTERRTTRRILLAAGILLIAANPRMAVTALPPLLGQVRAAFLLPAAAFA
ncbi:hypothetical protein [Bordetella genomosp. 13]|uniref:hypothetical protein n=1 Tax=Bordetella genomosp. 13 TaxID=463040 RepID=UPI001642A378|nr:hypothetical protein [Bordetella genomosp. 13]